MCDVYKTSRQQLALILVAAVLQNMLKFWSYCPQRVNSDSRYSKFEQASFVEPTNCCLKAKAQIPLVTSSVTGAGPIGLMFIMLVKYFGGKDRNDLLPSQKALSWCRAAFDARDRNLTAKIQELTDGMELILLC